MMYIIWQDDSTIDGMKKGNARLLSVLGTNHSFAEGFEGDNPLHPIGQPLIINQKEYKITRFEKSSDVTNVGVAEVA